MLYLSLASHMRLIKQKNLYIYIFYSQHVNLKCQSCVNISTVHEYSIQLPGSRSIIYTNLMCFFFLPVVYQVSCQHAVIITLSACFNSLLSSPMYTSPQACNIKPIFYLLVPISGENYYIVKILSFYYGFIPVGFIFICLNSLNES